MGRNKIETDFRNKLNQREITPTEEAWDRLDAMLTIAEVRKSKPKYLWLFIAASIIGFLFIGIGFFSKNEKIVDTKNNGVVVENNKKEMPIQEKMKLHLNEKTETAIVISEVNEIEKKRQASSPINKKTDKIIDYNQNQIAVHPNINQKIEQPNEQQSVVQKINNEVTIVTNIEVPLITKKPTIKVDAASLLSQVDGELEMSFREKVIKTVDKNFKTVKVALANRNLYQ